MKFSLVVTCFNESNSLPLWREDIEQQTRKPDEIVIVDSLSSDGTAQMLTRWSDEDETVHVISEKCSPARGHNIGNEAASHEWIVSTDMGIRIDRGWFEQIALPVEEDPTVEVVAGSYEVELDSVRSAAARAEHYISGNFAPNLGPGFIISNRSVAYRKSVWRELGGLPEDLTQYADDSVFGRQIVAAGYKMAFAPQAVVFWKRPEKLRDYWKEQRGYGRGDGEAYIKVPVAFRLHKSRCLPRALVPHLTGLRTLIKQVKLPTIFRAIRGCDIVGLSYLPLLSYGNGYHFAKAFMDGYDRGEIHCQDCRARLRNQ